MQELTTSQVQQIKRRVSQSWQHLSTVRPASCKHECDTLDQLENSGLNAHLAKPQRKSVCMGNRTESAC